MDYIKSIEAWSTIRGLDKSNSDKQLIKLEEELGELAEAHNKEWPDKIKDSLGYMFVTMAIYAQQNGFSLSDCIAPAYSAIKDHEGKMADGVFIKASGLGKDE